MVELKIFRGGLEVPVEHMTFAKNQLINSITSSYLELVFIFTTKAR